MLNDKDLVLVGSLKEISPFLGSERSLLSFFYRISDDGLLGRLNHFPRHKNMYMGICDLDFKKKVNVREIINDVLYEIKKFSFKGVFCDFDDFCPARAELIYNLDIMLHSKKIPFFVQAKYTNCTTHGLILLNSAVSGGSLRSYLREKYAELNGRVALELSSTCHKFKIPSYSSQGEKLSSERFSSLMRKYDPSIFFSAELCAKYFTFMEKDEGFFVIFDDNATLSQKISLANDLGIKYKFLSANG